MNDNFDLRKYLSNNILLKENIEIDETKKEKLDPKVKEWLTFQYEVFLEGAEEAEEFEFEEDEWTNPDQYEDKDIQMFLKSRDAIKKAGKVVLNVDGNKGTFTVNDKGSIVLNSPIDETPIDFSKYK